MRLFPIVFVVVAYNIALASSKKSSNVDEDSIIDQLLADPEMFSALDDPDKLLEMLRTHFAKRLDEDEERTISRCVTSKKRSGMIIRSQESQAAGAEFLNATIVQSRQDCIDSCCAITSCTTAITTEKDNKNGCYLFNCLSPGVCLFSSNEKFSSYDLSRRSSNSHISTSQPVVNNKFPLKGQLYSACDDLADCNISQHVQCISGYCMCQSDYHAVGSSCRKNCGQYQFECLNENEPDFVECVPVYIKCDGIEQCKDGSDESQCVDTKPTDDTNVKVSTVSHAATSKNSTSTALPVASTRTPKASSTPIPSSSGDDKARITRPSGLGTSASDEEKSIMNGREKWTVSAVKGAIVALVLGVLVVIALLVFGCCQLQRMRWNSRKGRMRSGTDADYLINGLYL